MIRRLLYTWVLLYSLNAIVAQDTFTLQEAIDYALANSNKMKSEALDEEDARQTVREFKSIGMPKVNIGARYNYYFFTPRQELDDFLTPAVYGTLARESLITEDRVPSPDQLETIPFSVFRKNNLSGYADAKVLLFDASYLKGLEAAKVSIDLSKQKAALTQRDISIGVTRAYLSALVANENIIFIEKNIENLQRSLFEVRELYKNGFVEQLDIDRLALSEQNLISEKEKFSNIIQLSYDGLKYQMSYPLNEDIILEDSLQTMMSLIQVGGSLDSIILDVRNRPEYHVLYKAIVLDGMDVDRLSKRLPTLTASIGVEAQMQRDKLFDNSEPGFLPSGNVGLGLNYPLFDGNEKSAQRQRSKIRKEKKQLELQEFERGMMLQIENAKTSLTNAKKSLDIQQKILTLSESVYNKSQIKYKEGVGSSVEVSQAEADLYQSQSAYVNAIYDVVLANAELDIALGKIK